MTSPPRGFEEGGYAASGIAALAVVASLMVAGIFDGDPKSDLYHFQGEFYPLVAQILPVLLLTVAVERRFFGPDLPGADTLASVLAFAVLILCAVVGEVTALFVTAFAKPGPTLRSYASITASAAVVGMLVLILWQAAINSGVIATLKALAADFEDEARREQRLRREMPLLVAIGTVVGVAAVVTAIIAAVRFFHRHDDDIYRAVLGLMYLLVIALWPWISTTIATWLVRIYRGGVRWLRDRLGARPVQAE